MFSSVIFRFTREKDSRNVRIRMSTRRREIRLGIQAPEDGLRGEYLPFIHTYLGMTLKS
jgi:hypothetical protein